MIRFSDAKVREIDMKQYTRDTLLKEISTRHLEDTVFKVFEEGTFPGIVLYQDLLLEEHDIKKCIRKEKIYFDETVFDNCRKFFRENSMHDFVPVYNCEDEIVYFAFEDNHIFSQACMRSLNSLLQISYVTFQNCYPDIEIVYLYEMNEVSYKFYHYLKKEGMKYQLIGDTWNLVDEYRNHRKKQHAVSEKEILSVFANGESENKEYGSGLKCKMGIDVGSYYWSVLGKIVIENWKAEVNKQAIALKRKGIATCMVKVPQVQELNSLTEDERYCYEHSICLSHIDILNKPEELEHLYKIYGKDMCEAYQLGVTQKGRCVANFHEIISFWMTEEEKQNTVFLIGPCIAYQTDLMAEETIVAHWQRKMDVEFPGKYRVRSIAMSTTFFPLLEMVFHQLYFRKGDIVIYIHDDLSKMEEIDYIDLTDLYNSRKKERWFGNWCIHVNSLGSKKIADYLWDTFLEEKCKNETRGIIVNYADELDATETEQIEIYKKQIECYLNQNKKECFKEGSIGAIVMNCNPYTLGHDYLISEASKLVDWLYIFVVEEDKSYFPFWDRFELVKRNTEKFSNVMVLPSGRMILSYSTLPTYFKKSEKQDAIVDATKDLKLFALGIAPYFKISRRFVGEEPDDKVTKQYNETMEELLPHYGIEVTEIQRKMRNGKVISASTVRKLLKSNDMRGIKDIVPDVTYEYLTEMMMNQSIDIGIKKHKDLFEKRYSEKKTLKKIVSIMDSSKERFQECKDSDSYRLLSCFRDSKEICVFGLGKMFHEHFFQDGWDKFIDVSVFSDNNIKWHGKEIHGISCVSPNELKFRENLMVITFVQNNTEICNQLDSMGINHCVGMEEMIELREWLNRMKYIDFDV